jgi:hypothetical protein
MCGFNNSISWNEKGKEREGLKSRNTVSLKEEEGQCSHDIYSI